MSNCIKGQYELLLNLEITNPIILDKHYVYLYPFLMELYQLEDEYLKVHYYQKLLELLENRPFLVLFFTSYNIIYGRDTLCEKFIKPCITFLFKYFSRESITNIMKSIPSNIVGINEYINQFIEDNICYPELTLDLVKILTQSIGKNEIFYLSQNVYYTDISKNPDKVDIYKFFLSCKNTYSIYGLKSELNYTIIGVKPNNFECLLDAGIKLIPLENVFPYLLNDEMLNGIQNVESDPYFDAYVKECFIRFKHNSKQFKKIFHNIDNDQLKLYLKTFDDINVMKKFILNTNFTQIKNEMLFKENKFGDVITYYLHRIKDGESENHVYNEMVKENPFILDLLGLNTIDKMLYLKEFVELY